MRCGFLDVPGRWRAFPPVFTVIIAIGSVINGGVAQATADPGSNGRQRTALGEDVSARVTGGGTVFAHAIDPTTVASFGVEARRPVGFVGGGAADGRINYDRHTDVADRHVNVPVVYMQASSDGRNRAGGQALLLGECTGAICPSGIGSVFVYVSDGADPGQDAFAIYFCSGPPSPPSEFAFGAPIPGCDPPEGGPLRSGNIQIRSEDR